jgi:hypothetical protein
MAYVDCSIRFDDEWQLDGDDCSYDRVVIITYEVSNGALLINPLESKEFYYKLGSQTSSTSDYKQLLEGSLKKTGTTYMYSFKLTPEQLAEARINGVIAISVWVKAKYKNSTIIYEAKNTQSELIQLPPESEVQNLTVEQYTNVPGKFKCSWNAPSFYKNKSDIEEVNGYCIRLDHKSTGGSLSRVRGLKLVNGLLVKDSNYKELTYKDTSGISESFIKNNNITFAGANCSSTSTEADEVYLTGTSFDFIPKDLGIESGDEYQFTIYPYNNYGTYFTNASGNIVETATGTRLTNEGTIYGTITSKGIVRVKHNNNWKEGQVWVMHNGVWKQAQAVYTMKDGKWLEAK